MIRLYIIFLLFTALGCSHAAQNAYTLDQKQLAALDNLMLNAITQKEIPGAVVLIANKEEILLHQAWGNSDIAQARSQSTEDIFRLASMTKPITAVAAMRLYEQGAFELDDSLATYIPAFRNPRVLDEYLLADSSFKAHSASKPITIRQLFTHSSGIGYGFQNDSLMAIFEKYGITEGFEERDILLADNVDQIAKMPLLHEPGERYTYGLSSDVLGRLIEIWSGQSLDIYLRDSIFSPLAMEDTDFYLAAASAERLTPVYMNTDTGVALTNYPLTHYPLRGAKRYLSGRADLSGTAYDYYRFCLMLLNKGSLDGQQLLKAETIDLMLKDQLGDGSMGLGLAIQHKFDPQYPRSIGSYSWGGFFATTFWVEPQKQIIAILLLQVYPFKHWEIQSQFEQIIYHQR
ncbi:MAG: serine hydrolase domain-containing protein [Bacteroidota bacterium]